MLVNGYGKLGNFLLAFSTAVLFATLRIPLCIGAMGPQGLLSGESSRWVVSLKAAEPCPDCSQGVALVFAVRDKLSVEASQFRLANETSRVSEIRVVNAMSAVILGITGGGNLVSVVALPSGRILDEFMCAGPAVSPDNHYVAFVKWSPAHFPPDTWASDEYLVYDLTRNAEYNRVNQKPATAHDPGWVLYPPGATNTHLDNIVHGSAVAEAHSMVSAGFYWLDNKDVVVFADRWEGVNRLILADINGGAQRPIVTVIPIDITRIVDLSSCEGKVAPSDFQKWSKNPASLILVTRIYLSPDNPRVLRLSFSGQPCLATTTLDVPFDEVGGATTPISALMNRK